MTLSSLSDNSNATEIEHATILHSGSGSVFYRNGFAPALMIPVNGSNLPNPQVYLIRRQDKIKEVTRALSSGTWIIEIDGMGDRKDDVRL